MHEEETEDTGPSKSAVKREMTARQKLGEALVGLSQRELARMPVEDEDLLRAIELAREIRSNSGRKRQLQYIGKLMRHIDPNPIAAALAELHQQHQSQVDQFHHLEELRDRLLEAGPDGLSFLVEQYPATDRQRVRQLLSQHRKEAGAGKPPAAARKLFKYLRELEEDQGSIPD